MTQDEEDPTSDLTPREKSAFFDLDLTQQMDIDRRRQLAGPLVFFYASSIALIFLLYVFGPHITDELTIMHDLTSDEARQEFFLIILKGAAFMVAITVTVMLNRFFTLILLVSSVVGVSGLAEDVAARLVASPDILDPILGAVTLVRLTYVIAIGHMLYIVLRPEAN